MVERFSIPTGDESWTWMVRETDYAALKAENETLREDNKVLQTEACRAWVLLKETAERALAERAGRLLDPDMPAQEMRLHMGEMTAQEMRTARAAIRWANTRQAERAGGVKAQLEAALAKVEYQPGDHPVVPVKHDQFVKDVRRIMSALTTEPAAPES